MSYKGIFIDDTIDQEHYADLLSTPGDDGLEISFQRVIEAPELADKIFASGIDIVLLDFRLDENSDTIAPKHSYLGSGLAQLLRDKAIAQPNLDLPIVLLSGEDKFDKYYRPDSTAHDLFDKTYGKEQATERSAVVSKQLLDLCKGYETLKGIWSSNGNRLSIFALDGGEDVVIGNQELRSELTKAAAPHLVANFVLRFVIDRPGLLLSDHDVAARLGVASIDPVVDYLDAQGIRYAGIFGTGWRRWWAHKFNGHFETVFGRRTSTMSGDERAAVLREKLGLKAEAATSRWNKLTSEKFAVACACCHYPTEIRHSVSAFDPNPPRFVQRRRICWDCIQTDRNIQEKLEVDDVDAKLAEQVKGKRRDEDSKA